MKKFEIINEGNGKATIKLIGEINWWRNSAAEFTRMIDDLVKSGIKDLYLYINTPGGSMFEANEIGNQLLKFTGSRVCKLGALCASAGTTVSTYMKQVIASSNTQYMIHDPMTFVEIAHLEDFESNKKLYVNLRNNAIDRYAKKTGMAKSDISEAMRATTWYNAEEAKAAGFVDEISDEVDNVLPPDANDFFNRTKLSLSESLRNQLQQSPQQELKNDDMKKIAARFGLPENSTEDQILEAINKEFNTLSNNAAKVLVVLGENKGMKKELVEKMAKADFDTALELVNETKVTTTTTNNSGEEKPEGNKSPDNRDNLLVNQIADLLKNGGGKPDATPELSFSEMADKKKDELIKMINETPEKAQELFKKEYGTTPKIDDLKNLVK